MTRATTDEIPQCYRHLEDRRGLVEVGHLTVRETPRAIRRSLPSMDHAARFLEALGAHLGNRIALEHDVADRRRLLLCDPATPGFIVPFPLIEHSFGAAQDTVEVAAIKLGDHEPITPIDAPPGWKPGDPTWLAQDPVPEILPTGPTMRGGAITIAEGPALITVSYDNRGWNSGASLPDVDTFSRLRYSGVKPFVIDTLSRPSTLRPLSLLLRPDLRAAGQTIDELVAMVAESELLPRVPARVRLPAPLPGGALDAWQRALPKLREALWSTVPASARCVAVDGYEGIAVAWGATAEDALAGWETAVREREPLPPGRTRVAHLPSRPAAPAPPAARAEAETNDGKRLFSTGSITVSFTGPTSTVDWPDDNPVNVPAALVRMPILPTEIPSALRALGFDRWVRLLGQYGNVRHALARDDGDGRWTLIGEGIVDVVDAAHLDAQLAAGDVELRATWADFADDDFRPSGMWCIASYRAWDSERQRAIPLARTGALLGGAWSAGQLDGDAVTWAVTKISRT